MLPLVLTAEHLAGEPIGPSSADFHLIFNLSDETKVIAHIQRGQPLAASANHVEHREGGNVILTPFELGYELAIDKAVLAWARKVMADRVKVRRYAIQPR